MDKQINKNRNTVKNTTDDKSGNSKNDSNFTGKNNQDNVPILSVSEALNHGNGLIKVKGLVINKSENYRSPFGRNYRCQNKDCKYYLIEKKLSRNGETSAISHPYEKVKCPYCKKQLYSVPYYVKHISISLVDNESNNHTQVLQVILADQLVSDVHIGDVITIKGRIFTRYNKFKKFTITKLEAQCIKDSNLDNGITIEKESFVIPKNFTESKENMINEIVKLFHPEIIGLDVIKKVLFLSLVNTSTPKSNISQYFDDRIHVLLKGSEDIPISILLKSTARLCNGIYININTNTTPIIVGVRKEDGKNVLKAGDVIFARNRILALDRIEQLKKNEIGYLEEVMKEGQINVNTEEFKEIIPARTTLIACMDVRDGSCTTKRIHDLSYNFDFICRCNSSSNITQQPFFHKDNNPATEDKFQLLKEHLEYARTINAELNDQAISKISDHCEAQTNLTNTYSAKAYEKLLKTTIAICRLNHKHVAGEQEVNEAIKFIESLYSETDSINNIVSLKEKIVIQCVAILKTLASPVEFNRLIQLVCNADETFREYLGEKLTISSNSKIREIAQILKNHSKIQVLKEKPLVLKYIL